MSDKKYTPGPWETTHNGFYYDICPQGDIQSFASTHDNTYLTGDEQANANLIAAAPELLEALEVVVELARVKYGNLDTDITEQFDKADVAIAKAHGETP